MTTAAAVAAAAAAAKYATLRSAASDVGPVTDVAKQLAAVRAVLDRACRDTRGAPITTMFDRKSATVIITVKLPEPRVILNWAPLYTYLTGRLQADVAYNPTTMLCVLLPLIFEHLIPHDPAKRAFFTAKAVGGVATQYHDRTCPAVTALQALKRQRRQDQRQVQEGGSDGWTSQSNRHMKRQRLDGGGSSGGSEEEEDDQAAAALCTLHGLV